MLQLLNQPSVPFRQIPLARPQGPSPVDGPLFTIWAQPPGIEGKAEDQACEAYQFDLCPHRGCQTKVKKCNNSDNPCNQTSVHLVPDCLLVTYEQVVGWDSLLPSDTPPPLHTRHDISLVHHMWVAALMLLPAICNRWDRWWWCRY